VRSEVGVPRRTIGDWRRRCRLPREERLTPGCTGCDAAERAAAARWFPQHGPGKKHTRPIILTSWQSEIIATEPRPFVRGLIHSDGCRITALERSPTGRERRAVRYLFTNLSDDIKALYCESLDTLGIPWTRPSQRQIAVYRVAGVAKLEQFVGPKS